MKFRWLVALPLTMALLACSGATPTPTPTSTATPIPLPTPTATPASLSVKIRWLGHASFLITSERSGLRIVTDPYMPSANLLHAPPDEEADIVIVSHEHTDHNNVVAVRGNPQALRGLALLGGAPEVTQTVRGVEFKIIATAHDDRGGSLRGANAVFCFTLDGVRVCHLGDLGHLLSADQLARIGAVDVLLIPTGGGPTIDAAQARSVVGQLRPRVVIAMHMRSDRCTFPTDDVEAFVAGQSRVRRLAGDASFVAGQLPEPTEFVVLRPTK